MAVEDPEDSCKSPGRPGHGVLSPGGSCKGMHGEGSFRLALYSRDKKQLRRKGLFGLMT